MQDVKLCDLEEGKTMIFVAETSTPANTLATSPLTTLMPIRWGIIHRVEIKIPTGHVGLTGLRIKHATILKWPTTPAVWFTGNGISIDFQVFFPVIHEPFTLEIETYNTDTAIAHGHNVLIGVLPPWAVYFTPKSQWDSWGERLFD